MTNYPEFPLDKDCDHLWEALNRTYEAWACRRCNQQIDTLSRIYGPPVVEEKGHKE